MGVRVKDDSQFKEIYVKALDSMPVGSIVEYNGTVGDIPAGWEQANDIIWTNSSPSSTISTSTISNIDMTNYDELEVGFRQYNSNDILTIARFKKVIGTTPVLSYSEVGNGFWVIRSRVLNLTSNTSIGITQGYQTVTGGTASASDNVCIPVYIKGYNTGLIKKTTETRPLASHTVNAYSESESNAYSCNYVNKTSIETIYNNNETFAFNGNTYANKNITLPKNISRYKMLLINVGEPYGTTYYEQMLIPANLLISGNAFRKFIFLASIQSYMQIKYNSDNSINIWLEHTSAISGNKTIKVNIVSLNNYQAEQTQPSTRSLNTYSGDIEEKKNIVIDDGGEEKPIDDGNNK